MSIQAILKLKPGIIQVFFDMDRPAVDHVWHMAVAPLVHTPGQAGFSRGGQSDKTNPSTWFKHTPALSKDIEYVCIDE